MIFRPIEGEIYKLFIFDRQGRTIIILHTQQQPELAPIAFFQVNMDDCENIIYNTTFRFAVSDQPAVRERRRNVAQSYRVT